MATLSYIMQEIIMSKFANIVSLPRGYQLKLKINSGEIQNSYPTLKEAIQVRNLFYTAGYIPRGIYLTIPKLKDLVKNAKRIQHSGTTVKVWQIHCKRIEDNQYSPRIYTKKANATKFAKNWLNYYLPVVALYNEERKHMFDVSCRAELKYLYPFIQRGFDAGLWEACVKTAHGSAIPTLAMCVPKD